ncbi:MAG: VIT family protein [Myxococcales bacterium]|nr:VIT family protein [Myxococcales bacterium]MBK7198789.1 VIT family protein [Myxococcales bacterium]MBP6844899.1 VIT family protein [Kofleriaceae bacterium]
MPARHHEIHKSQHTGWLRAAVLGANDGLLSTASLLAGVAAADATRGAVLVAGVAGLVGGALSMAAGEYVSVSSQADTERADLARETRELAASPEHEHEELASIYVARGLERPLAEQVARQLMAHDALGAHARDELGLTETGAARPLQAAASSAAAFALGAAWPLALAALVPMGAAVAVITGASLAALVGLGALAARVGGAGIARGALRVGALGAVAMAASAAIGAWFGTVV